MAGDEGARGAEQVERAIAWVTSGEETMGGTLRTRLAVMRAGWLSVAFGALLVACNGERRREHEVLSAALSPVHDQLCEVQWAEGGGCNGDCAVSKAAAEGRHLRVASDHVGRLATSRDAATEVLLGEARSRASALTAALGACPEALKVEEDLNAELRACAAARSGLRGESRALLDALDALRTHVDDDTGVMLPPMRGPCDER